ncbi:P-loop containing nucleoside triphosphate hydrolase protein [Globomyces pollinis-pini]|nr:P-loop containing nucleoside triphosphate hydrolase protein [Globomyces pollinis-pini]
MMEDKVLWNRLSAPKDMFVQHLTKKSFAGYFCPSGTFEPIKCDMISSCPEGTFHQTSYNGIVVLGILDLILLALVIGRTIFEKKRAAALDSGLPQTDTKQTSSPEKILTDAFKRSLNGRELKMNFKMDKLGYTLPNGKTILQGVSGPIRSSRMTAIMGPSGAGKTTFMNVLCGKVNRTSGHLWVSGKEVELEPFKKIYGFVPQEDIMHRELTVRENILHSARIRLPKGWTNSEIEEHVDNVLKMLNLSHVAHTIIGDETTRGISGGQRKRVNIGIEIAAAPICLFLDEPTSGLDSSAALEVAEMLKHISKLGITIVAVIHQPRTEIFHTFDDVLMIAPGGKTAYLGPTEEVIPYYKDMGFEFPAGINEADVLMDILSNRGVNPIKTYNSNELTEKWAERELEEIAKPVDDKSEKTGLPTQSDDEDFHKYVPDLIAARGASYLKQFMLAHNLSILQQYRNVSGLILEFCVCIVAGVLMGMSVQGFNEFYVGLYTGSLAVISPAPVNWLVPQFGMLIGCTVALAGSAAGVQVFGEELPIYWRNASSGHSPISYYLGKTIATIYRIFLSSLHFAAILFVLAKPMIPFWVQFAMIGLMFYGVYGLCSFVSMVVKRENASLLAVIFSLIAAVFCGYGPTLVDVKSWKLFWVWALQFNMWGCEAQFNESLKIYENVYDNSFANDAFGYTLNQTGFDFLMMVVIGSSWRVLGYIAMIGMNRDKQR